MPNICEHCGETFYSDTAYEEHLKEEKFWRTWQQLLETSNKNANSQLQLITYLGNNFRLLCFLLIMYREGISPEEASQKISDYEKHCGCLIVTIGKKEAE